MKSKIPKNYCGSILTYGLIEEALKNLIHDNFEYKEIRPDAYSHLEGFYIPISNDKLTGIYVNLMNECVYIMSIELIIDNKFKDVYFKVINSHGVFELYNLKSLEAFKEIIQLEIYNLKMLEKKKEYENLIKRVNFL